MREVHCADALEWLPANPCDAAVVTSLPDADETGMDMDVWSEWFVRAATACMRYAAPAAPAVFYQTDRKANGMLHSKTALLFEAHHEAGVRLLWHKIVLRRDPGMVDLHRPGFTHLLAFSQSARPGQATPDVIERGQMIYSNAMGLAAATFAVRFAMQSAAKVICDPFCGRGTVLAVAEALGMDTIGVDIDPLQAEAARRLRIKPVREAVPVRAL